MLRKGQLYKAPEAQAAELAAALHRPGALSGQGTASKPGASVPPAHATQPCELQPGAMLHVLCLAVNVASGMQYLHEKQVIHGGWLFLAQPCAL